MKHFYPAICVLALAALSSCAIKQVTPSSTFVTFEVAASAINAIDASSSIKVIYTQSPKTAILVETPDNLSDMLDITVTSGKLSAGMKPNTNINGSSNVTIHVSSPSIKDIDLSSASSLEIAQGLVIDGNLSVDASSAAHISIAGLTGENLSIDSSSSAQVAISAISVSSIDADASSASQINLDGQCQSVRFDASSAASIDASGLKAEGGFASASSAASISCNSPNLKTKASSGGSINN